VLSEYFLAHYPAMLLRLGQFQHTRGYDPCSLRSCLDSYARYRSRERRCPSTHVRKIHVQAACSSAFNLYRFALYRGFHLFIVRIWPPTSNRQALLMGLVWVLLAGTFETFMGLVLQHRTMHDVLYEYNHCEGRVWSFFLVWLGLAPWTLYCLGRV